MTPMAQTKSQELLKTLNSYAISSERLGDIDKYKIRKELETLIKIDPFSAHMGFAILATSFDKDESEMQRQYGALFTLAPKNPFVFFNYSKSLREFGYYDKAQEALAKALAYIHEGPSTLSEIAETAYMHSAHEMYFEIIEKSNKLNITSPSIGLIAAEVMLANCDSEDEEIDILNQMFPYDDSGKNGIIILSEEWKDIVKFADELKEYE